jgi:hypothetical protein
MLDFYDESMMRCFPLPTAKRGQVLYQANTVTSNLLLYRANKLFKDSDVIVGFQGYDIL